MKNSIIPAVLPKNFKELEVFAHNVSVYVPIIQIDICDGVFVGSNTWPLEQNIIPQINDAFEMPDWELLDYECDLMVREPSRFIDFVKNIGASKVVLHYGSDTDENLLHTIEVFRNYDIEIGIGVQNSMNLDMIKEFVHQVIHANEYIPYIQVMGIETIGKQGEPFDMKTLETLEALKVLLPECILQVDGAVGFETIPALKNAGATQFVIGSALSHREFLGDALKELKHLAQ